LTNDSTGSTNDSTELTNDSTGSTNDSTFLIDDSTHWTFDLMLSRSEWIDSKNASSRHAT
jgi:hypothetical protein